jgi:hypothetical protein
MATTSSKQYHGAKANHGTFKGACVAQRSDNLFGFLHVVACSLMLHCLMVMTIPTMYNADGMLLLIIVAFTCIQHGTCPPTATHRAALWHIRYNNTSSNTSSNT